MKFFENLYRTLARDPKGAFRHLGGAWLDRPDYQNTVQGIRDQITKKNFEFAFNFLWPHLQTMSRADRIHIAVGLLADGYAREFLLTKFDGDTVREAEQQLEKEKTA